MRFCLPQESRRFNKAFTLDREAAVGVDLQSFAKYLQRRPNLHSRGARREHPELVDQLAPESLRSKVEPLLESVARRAGVIKNRKVTRRTTLLLLRLRYHIVVMSQRGERALLAEDSIVVPFAGSPQNPEWLPQEQSVDYLALEPEQNVAPDIAANFIRKIVDGFGNLQPHLEKVARHRGDELRDAHRRVRAASLQRNVSYRVDPSLPPDALGIYLYLPVVD